VPAQEAVLLPDSPSLALWARGLNQMFVYAPILARLGPAMLVTALLWMGSARWSARFSCRRQQQQQQQQQQQHIDRLAGVHGVLSALQSPSLHCNPQRLLLW
jgi:hypothetical protein